MTCPEAPPAGFAAAPDLLQNRNILLTGADTDLGNALALAFSACGATLLMPARKERLLAPLYDRIVDDGGAEPLLIAMDMERAEEAQFADLAAGLGNEISGLHGIVHADLPSAPLAPLANTSVDTWHTCYRRMLLQPMLLVRSLLPLMGGVDGAEVIFLTLPCGRRGKPNWGPLGAALAGLENLCQGLGREHPGIRFGTLDTGPVGSDLRRRFYPAEARSDLPRVDDRTIMNAFVYRLSGGGRC